MLAKAVFDADRAPIRSPVAPTGFFRDDEIDVAVDSSRTGWAAAPNRATTHVCGTRWRACRLRLLWPDRLHDRQLDLFWIAVEPQGRSGTRGAGRTADWPQSKRVVSASGGPPVYIDTSGQAKYVPTRAFYEHSGYELAAKLADFYAPGDDRVIYAAHARSAGRRALSG